MARKRNPMRDEAYRIWIESDKTKPLKDIAEELGVSASTIRKWKSEGKWSGETKRSAPNETERYESMHGNQNAKGNPGNPSASPPKGNQNAVSHGLFAKHLPDETKELVQELFSSEPADIIWNNIMIQYAAIIRAQKIMYVKDEFDTTSSVTRVDLNPMLIDVKTKKPAQTSEQRENQYAWDKQANFMNAQARAMTTLSNLIKQFVAIADEQDMRRKKLEMMDAQIDTIRAKARAANEDESELFEEDGFMDALNALGGELWASE
jgi:uncharacterized protein YjcR